MVECVLLSADWNDNNDCCGNYVWIESVETVWCAGKPEFVQFTFVPTICNQAIMKGKTEVGDVHFNKLIYMGKLEKGKLEL